MNHIGNCFHVMSATEVNCVSASDKQNITDSGCAYV